MATKKVHAENTKEYIINAEVDGFNYTQDFVGRDPNKEEFGTSPTGLLLASLSGCYLMTARSFFNKNDIESSTLDTDISGDFIHSDEEGWKVEAEVVLTTSAKLNDEQEENLKQFIDRFCKVSSVLSHGNTINFTIEKV